MTENPKSPRVNISLSLKDIEQLNQIRATVEANLNCRLSYVETIRHCMAIAAERHSITS